MSDHMELLAEVIERDVAPNAAEVDRNGEFPRRNIESLREAGLLGIMSAPSMGGGGLGPVAAVEIVAELGRNCSSTAMIVCMHYAATAVIESCGDDEVRRAIAENRHLSTLAFSEAGSRSHFWAPISTATAQGDEVVLDAQKSWVTSAGEADSYVWSSKPLAAEGASTLWFVPSGTPGLKIGAAFDGLGLRGNNSSPIAAIGARVAPGNRLGDDGGGFDLMIGTVLPWFNLMNAAMSLGLMDAAVTRSASHMSSTRLEHLDESLAANPVNRLHLARAKVRADQAAALVRQAASSVEAQSEDAMLRVLESKVAAGDAAIEVTDLCMRVCGGSAFRKEVGVERLFRDARAAAVMAPTSDTLYDFIGKALCDIPLF